MKCEKDRLLEEIGILDFVVVELVLFLDTHPRHQEAMHYFDYYNQMLQEKGLFFSFSSIILKNKIQKDPKTRLKSLFLNEKTE